MDDGEKREQEKPSEGREEQREIYKNDVGENPETQRVRPGPVEGDDD